MTRVALVGLVACVVPACGASARVVSSHIETAAPSRVATEIAQTTAIHFDLGGRPTHLPLLRATIAGRPTSLLLDTGATHHALGSWFARDVGLDVREAPGEAGVDHDGHYLSVHRARVAESSLEGWGAIAVDDFLVLELPPLFEASGVAGILSPQLLADHDHSVVLDFPRRTMTLSVARDAERVLAGAGGCALLPRPATPCGAASPGDAPIFATTASIEGRNVFLAIDTGSVATDVLASVFPSSPTLAADAASGGSANRTLPSARVLVGACDLARDVAVAPGDRDPACARDGVLGIDVLASCVLVVARDHLAATCGG